MIDHQNKDNSSNSNFWTTSFRKLLLSTEDDKKLRVVNKILRKALCGLGSEKVQRPQKCDAYLKEKSRRKSNATRSSGENNNKNEPRFQIQDPEPIYETIRISRPKMIADDQNPSSREWTNASDEQKKTQKMLSSTTSIYQNENEYVDNYNNKYSLNQDYELIGNRESNEYESYLNNKNSLNQEIYGQRELNCLSYLSNRNNLNRENEIFGIRKSNEPNNKNYRGVKNAFLDSPKSNDVGGQNRKSSEVRRNTKNLINVESRNQTGVQRSDLAENRSQNIGETEILNSIPLRQVASKIALFERLSRASSPNSTGSTRSDLNTFFSEGFSAPPSPIMKLNQGDIDNKFFAPASPVLQSTPRVSNQQRLLIRRGVPKPNNQIEKKFVVNCYESRPRGNQQSPIRRVVPNGDIIRICGDSEDDVDYERIGDIATYANIDEAKRPLDSCECLVVKRPRRVTHRSILDAMEEIELMSGMELIGELQRRATQLEKQMLSKKTCDGEEPLYATPNKIYKKVAEVKRDDADANNNCNEGFFKLKQQADIHCKVMKQAAKALEIYRGGSCQGYADARIEVEAEKILLTASYNYQLIVQEIRNAHYESPSMIRNVGSVIVRDIKVELKGRGDVGVVDEVHRRKKTKAEWFVCIVSDEEEHVICSKAVEVTPDCKEVVFDEVFSFENLDCGFKLKAEIFSLRPGQWQKRTFSLKLNKGVSTLSRKLLYKDVQTYSLVESNIPDTSFVREGGLSLTVAELTSSCKDWKLDLQPGSRLTGKCDLEARITHVEVDAEKTGFLTIGSESYTGINWNRRWCVLRGTVLNFWSYPNDEDRNPPLGSIDLRDSAGEVTNAKRSFCPRTRTLLLEGIGEEVYFLNADCIGDMHDWRNKLNRAYHTLKSWSMLRIQQGTDV